MLFKEQSEYIFGFLNYDHLSRFLGSLFQKKGGKLFRNGMMYDLTRQSRAYVLDMLGRTRFSDIYYKDFACSEPSFTISEVEREITFWAHQIEHTSDYSVAFTILRPSEHCFTCILYRGVQIEKCYSHAEERSEHAEPFLIY